MPRAPGGCRERGCCHLLLLAQTHTPLHRRASRYRPSSSSERWSSGPPLPGAARRPTELTAEVACHSRSLPTRQRCRTRNSRPYAEEAMSETSPQGSFLRTLPYGSRDPAHLPPPRSPREERTYCPALRVRYCWNWPVRWGWRSVSRSQRSTNLRRRMRCYSQERQQKPSALLR